MRRAATLPRALYRKARGLLAGRRTRAASPYAALRVRVAFHGFWPGFSLRSFLAAHPYLKLKYELTESRRRPDVHFVSVFAADGRVVRDAGQIAVPGDGRATVFYTGERVSPAGGRFDWSIGYDAGCGDAGTEGTHLYLPGWVRQLNRLGLTPCALVRRDAGPRPESDGRSPCAYVVRHRTALREAFFDRLAERMEIVAPGRSRNNHAPIGGSVWDKLAFLRHFRFNLAFENERAPSYLSEKIADAFASGCVPIYCGDPLVERTFSPDAFVHVRGREDFGPALERILAIERDPASYRAMRAAAPLLDNRLPDYATHDYAMAFFERVFDAALGR